VSSKIFTIRTFNLSIDCPSCSTDIQNNISSASSEIQNTFRMTISHDNTPTSLQESHTRSLDYINMKPLDVPDDIPDDDIHIHTRPIIDDIIIEEPISSIPATVIYDENIDNNQNDIGGNTKETSDYEDKKLTLLQAIGLNTMNMFGTGPFITIPFVVAATDPAGPQALLGYAMAAFACMNDSLIWSELGSIWPDSGGSYVYLRELYGRNKFGRLMAFLFVWQIMVSGPMECASGFIATAQYISYIDGNNSYWHHAGIAFIMCLLTIFALYREIDDVGSITIVLWIATLMAIIFVIIVGYTTFDTELIQPHPEAFNDGGKLFMSLGIAARYAVYDFTGYYDVNFVGKEVQNPTRTIPIACISTCCVVACVFFLVDVAVMGSLEWRAEHGGYVRLVQSGDNSANYIMAIFCETHISRSFAIFFTLVVAVTIFGSCFSFMIGLAQIPYTAAKDGYFYDWLSHEHPTMRGLSDYSLLFVGAISCLFCFVELSVVIEGMLTMQLLIQFIAQSVGLIYYRYYLPINEQEKGAFNVPWFPLPNIIQIIIFSFIFLTTDNYLIKNGTPLMEVALLFLITGIVFYFLWAKNKGFWPYISEKEVKQLPHTRKVSQNLKHLAIETQIEMQKNCVGSLTNTLNDRDRSIHKLQEEIDRLNSGALSPRASAVCYASINFNDSLAYVEEINSLSSSQNAI